MITTFCIVWIFQVVATRVVFDIKCLENSSKQITVKSAITLNNQTEYNMEARLESLVQQGET